MMAISNQKNGKLHPRNPHAGSYNFELLVQHLPQLEQFIILNPNAIKTIDFANPRAVKLLNSALLAYYYQISGWDIPTGYLCPPIPGRADYIHYLADLIGEKPLSNKVLDIGTGANLIYPILGSKSYNWDFVAADIDSTALQSAEKILTNNPALKNKTELRFQPNSHHIFEGIIQPTECFAATLCNPPFHASAAEAAVGSVRKSWNLTRKNISKPVLNFAGQSNELWCKGGELNFIRDMMNESQNYANQVGWFTCLVSKKENLEPLERFIKKLKIPEFKTIAMAQGNKQSRLVAWRFNG